MLDSSIMLQRIDAGSWAQNQSDEAHYKANQRVSLFAIHKVSTLALFKVRLLLQKADEQSQ